MRIGVDVSCLSEPTNGICQYTLMLLSEMVKHGHEWILYSYRPIIHGNWSRDNVFVKTNNLRNRLWKPLWAQSFLPSMILVDKLDLFWSPAHRFPFFLPDSVSSVVTIHDLLWRRYPETMNPLGRLLDAWLMPNALDTADWIIAVSKSTAEDLKKEFSGIQDKTTVVYEAAPHITSQIGKCDQICGEKKYILFVGTMEPRKNLRRLIHSYSMMPDWICKQYQLVIVGGKGWGKENVNDLIAHYDAKDFVNVLGFVENSELDILYRNATLFIMPSIYEGFGLPLLEAMSRGVPVITSANSSMAEVVGDAAILVDPLDVQSITSGMRSLLENDELREILSAKGRERSKSFSWSKAAADTLHVFSIALKRHATAL